MYILNRVTIIRVVALAEGCSRFVIDTRKYIGRPVFQVSRLRE